MPNLRKKLPSANALFVFEAAARCGNFTRAAQELYVSQPAVSRMLSRMEEHVGVQLFDRARGGTTLTESGKILYRKIKEGFAGIEGALDEIAARATGVETVTLSVSTAFTTHWLMPRMSRLNAAFPKVDLRFQLISGRIGGPLVDVDLGMRFKRDDEMDEQCLFVMPEILIPVCSRRYAQEADGLSSAEGPQTQSTQPISPKDHGSPRKAGDTIIIMDDGERGWHERFSAFADKRRHAGSTLSFSDYAIVVQAALLGQGIALGWVNVVSHWIADGALIPAEEELLVMPRQCCLVWPGNRPMRPAVKALRDWIVTEIHADLAALALSYPRLGLEQVLHPAGEVSFPPPPGT